MNIVLWIIQVLLALHTLVGALWKFYKSAADTMPTLASIPEGLWMALSVVEIACAALLILPIFVKSLSRFAPIAALVIAAEMVVFTIVHFMSGSREMGTVIYWLIVAVIAVALAAKRGIRSPT